GPELGGADRSFRPGGGSVTRGRTSWGNVSSRTKPPPRSNIAVNGCFGMYLSDSTAPVTRKLPSKKAAKLHGWKCSPNGGSSFTTESTVPSSLYFTISESGQLGPW